MPAPLLPRRAAVGEEPQHGVLAALAQAVYLALRLRQRRRLWRDIAKQKEAILQRIRDMENELAELRRALQDLLQ